MSRTHEEPPSGQMPWTDHAHDSYNGDSDEEDYDVVTRPEASLLNGHRITGHSERGSYKYDLTRKGKLRAYWLGLVVCIGGFLHGYDSGLIGGVLTLSSYRRDFDFDDRTATRVSSLAIGLQQFGGFAACFAIWPITRKFGRKPAIAICSFIFVIGAMVQTLNMHSTSIFFAGRFIAGVGLGGTSVVVPMFSAEMTPKQMRGQIGSFYQLMFTLGIFTSYWTDWAVAKDIPDTQSRQWQIPVGLQMLFASLLGLGTTTLKESTRWLTMKGRYAEAWESLKWVRASDDEDVQLEMEEIKLGVETEARAKEGFKFKEMLQKSNASRTITAICMFIAQQATGATAFAYYGPQYFKLLVGDKEHADLLLTAIFGAVKVTACTAFVILVADNIPRRTILTGGAISMAACQIATAVVARSNPAPEDGTITTAGIATVALIYLFVTFYNFSWGPLTWPYVAEIFPSRIRESGMAIAVACQWASNMVFSITTPYMIKNLGWATFLLWGLFGILIASYSWFGLIETRGKSLEQIAQLDGGIVKSAD